MPQFSCSLSLGLLTKQKKKVCDYEISERRISKNLKRDTQFSHMKGNDGEISSHGKYNSIIRMRLLVHS